MNVLRWIRDEWVRPRRRNYHAACCDCNLVHRVDFKLVKIRGELAILIRAKRDVRATAALRRHRGVPIREGKA